MRVVATRDLSVAQHKSEDVGEEDDLTNLLTGDQRGGAPNLFTPNSRVHHHGGAGRVVPSIWTAREHLGWPPYQGPWRWSQEGGLRPDRRDLGAMEEQDEGSIGRSPDLSFCKE